MTTAVLPLEGWLEARRAGIDRALETYLPAAPRCPPSLDVAMRYSVRAGGKRFRPLLTLAAAEAVQADGNLAARLALPAACAVELVHTYSLIHDDLPAMDDDTLRRGHPTSHVVFGEGLAILAGDGLLTEAFSLLAREPATADPEVAGRKLHAIAMLAEAAGATGMVGGQAEDLQAAGRVRDPGDVVPDLVGAFRARVVLDAASLRSMHARKTGALIRTAATIGAVMAGGARAQVEAIASFATEMGLAFQIVDDVLDVEGVEKDLGKTAGKDAASGKTTYPALFGLAESKRLAADTLARALSALDRAGVAGHLPAIARWVVARTR